MFYVKETLRYQPKMENSREIGILLSHSDDKTIFATGMIFFSTYYSKN